MPSYVATAEDRYWFARCRRAWDFGALARRDLDPERPVGPREQLERAFRSALAVHYFPGMWQWDRTIVAGHGPRRGATSLRTPPLTAHR